MLAAWLMAGAAPAFAGSRTVLAGNHSPEAAAMLASAPAIAPERTLRMAIAMLLRNQSELDNLLRDQQDPNSPMYHRWLAPGEFTARFGPTQEDLAKVAAWLAGAGFQVDAMSADQRMVEFHGRADTAERAFAVKIAANAGATAFANLADPSVPSQIAPLVASVAGLSNAPHWLAAFQPAKGSLTPIPAEKIGKYHAFAPSDIWNFYDEYPVFSVGNYGSADCLANVEDSDYDTASVQDFYNKYGLYWGLPYNIYVDADSNPGENSDQFEALIDVEYSKAVAPASPNAVYIGDPARASAYGALYDAAARAVSDDSCSSINISFAFCGLSNADYTGVIDPLAKQAASQGQVVTVASGDWGAAALQLNSSMTGCVVSKTRGVSELAADPYVLAVGGTQFHPKYDKSGDDVGSKKEKAWNDHKLKNGGATGGGISAVFTQPSYQQGVEPSQSMRTVPDVAFGASERHPGFVVFGPYQNSVYAFIAGGTSLAAPVWSGISHLVQQERNGARPGSLNSALYSLGPGGAASGIRDVRGGNNTFNGVKGYKATPGYDLATGWGTPDIGVLVPALAGQ